VSTFSMVGCRATTVGCADRLPDPEHLAPRPARRSSLRRAVVSPAVRDSVGFTSAYLPGSCALIAKSHSQKPGEKALQESRHGAVCTAYRLRYSAFRCERRNAMPHGSMKSKRIAFAALLAATVPLTPVALAAPAHAYCVWNATVLRTFCYDDDAPPPPPPEPEVACDNIGPGGTTICNHDIWVQLQQRIAGN
jgi:hypothetical protein